MDIASRILSAMPGRARGGLWRFLLIGMQSEPATIRCGHAVNPLALGFKPDQAFHRWPSEGGRELRSYGPKFGATDPVV